MSYGVRRRASRLDGSPFHPLLILFLFCLPAVGVSEAPPQPGSTPLCLPDDHTLCLNDSRFAVSASFQSTPSGVSVQATAVPLTEDTGYFWFFEPGNVELVTKVLNACDPFGAYWVFASGLTNLGVTIAVTDLFSEQTRTYTNPLGTPFVPVQDTDAFHTCP